MLRGTRGSKIPSQTQVETLPFSHAHRCADTRTRAQEHIFPLSTSSTNPCHFPPSAISPLFLSSNISTLKTTRKRELRVPRPWVLQVRNTNNKCSPQVTEGEGATRKQQWGTGRRHYPGLCVKSQSQVPSHPKPSPVMPLCR